MHHIPTSKRVDFLTPENVRVDSVYTGYQLYHDAVLLGDIAIVRGVNNSGSFTFLPPTITIDGEKYHVTAILHPEDKANRHKLYFRPYAIPSRESFIDQLKPYPAASVTIASRCQFCGSDI